MKEDIGRKLEHAEPKFDDWRNQGITSVMLDIYVSEKDGFQYVLKYSRPYEHINQRGKSLLEEYVEVHGGENHLQRREEQLKAKGIKALKGEKYLDFVEVHEDWFPKT